METEDRVADHYSRSSPTRAVHAALAAAGSDLNRLTPADLAPFEHLHMGGRKATVDLGENLDLRAGMELLDIGCGVGGSARFFGQEHKCRVTGIDLTPEFVALAEDLTRRVGLGASAQFQQGSALQMPFPDGAFDRAYMLHVGMNIEDKARVFVETFRVLKPGGLIGVYDVMRIGDGAVTYPVPWANTEETSFLASVTGYRRDLEKAGFSIQSERDLWVLGIAGDTALNVGRPKHGSQIFMGENAAAKDDNLYSAVTRRVISPVQIVARKNFSEK
jgi:SAM-dependent methyltransferase